VYWYNTGWGWSFFGMSVLWWIFWVALIGVFFAMATPVPRRRARSERPLDILARRYAAGEITHEEYELRRDRILRDLEGGAPRSVSPPPRTTPPVTPTPNAA
jgi:putative membrane protein